MTLELPLARSCHPFPQLLPPPPACCRTGSPAEACWNALGPPTRADYWSNSVIPPVSDVHRGLQISHGFRAPRDPESKSLGRGHCAGPVGRGPCSCLLAQSQGTFCGEAQLSVLSVASKIWTLVRRRTVSKNGKSYLQKVHFEVGGVYSSVRSLTMEAVTTWRCTGHGLACGWPCFPAHSLESSRSGRDAEARRAVVCTQQGSPLASQSPEGGGSHVRSPGRRGSVAGSEERINVHARSI